MGGRGLDLGGLKTYRVKSLWRGKVDQQRGMLLESGAGGGWKQSSSNLTEHHITRALVNM